MFTYARRAKPGFQANSNRDGLEPTRWSQYGNRSPASPLARPTWFSQTDARTRSAAERQADSMGELMAPELAGVGPVGPGPLPGPVREIAETLLDVDLKGTQLAADETANQLAQRCHADAVTAGSSIAFSRGSLSTTDSGGRALLAHELTHVAQQRAWNTGASVPQFQERKLPDLAEPDFGSATIRLRSDGTLELLAGLPKVPQVGAGAIGARREPSGKWSIVFGPQPKTADDKAYTWKEILELLHSASPDAGAGPAVLPLPRSSSSPPQLTFPAPPSPSVPQFGVPRVAGEGAPKLSLGAPPSQLSVPSLLAGYRHAVLDGFAFDSKQLPAGNQSVLARVAEAWKASDTKHFILLEGHTDSIGTEAYNEGLGQQRAEEVARALEALGVEGAYISATSVGMADPFPGNDEASRRRSRRVEISWNESSTGYRLRAPTLGSP